MSVGNYIVKNVNKVSVPVGVIFTTLFVYGSNDWLLGVIKMKLFV